MKHLLVVLIFLLLTSSSYAVEVNLEPYITIPSDPENIVQSGEGIQLSIQHKKIYAYVSTDCNPIRFSGQRGIDINLDSLGIGFEHKFLSKDAALLKFLTREGIEIKENKQAFSIFFDVGWYEPRYKNEKQDFPSTHSEGLWRYLNKELSLGNRAIMFPAYSSDYAGALGGKLGIAYKYTFTKKFSLGVNLKYRYLQLEENLKGYDDPRTHNDWHYIKKRNFGGAQVGLFFTYNF